MRFLINLVMLVFVLSACNLGSDDELVSTLESTSTALPAGKPNVTIISPANGSEFVVNEPVLMSVNVSDTIGVTRIQLLVDGQISRTFSSELSTGDTNKNMVIDYTPRVAGTVNLRVVAYRDLTASDPADITITVRSNQTQITATAQQPSGLPTINASDPTCRVVVNTGLNFRKGPGIEYERILTLSYGEVIPVIGRIGDNSWWQLRRSGLTVGWVSADYVTAYGNCAGIPIIASPPTPTSSVATATAIATSVPTNTAVPINTAIPTQPSLPNLTITDITGSQFVTIPSGETSVVVTYSANITNRGGALNSQFSNNVQILPGGAEFDAGVVANLAEGQSISLSADVTFSEAGTYILQFSADSDDDIEESIEVDNSGSLTVTVVNE